MWYLSSVVNSHRFTLELCNLTENSKHAQMFACSPTHSSPRIHMQVQQMDFMCMTFSRCAEVLCRVFSACRTFPEHCLAQIPLYVLLSINLHQPTLILLFPAFLTIQGILPYISLIVVLIGKSQTPMKFRVLDLY